MKCSFLHFIVAIATFLAGVASVIAQDKAFIVESINKLVGADEFAREQFDQLEALPVDAVPLLADNLRKVPKGVHSQPHFMLLASKVNQFERQLDQSVLDDAVAGLLERLQPEDHDTNPLKVSLRIKLKNVAFIKDPRIVEGVRKARVFLGMEPDIADPAYRPSLPGKAAAAVSTMAEQAKTQAQIATATNASNSPQTTSTPWPALIVMGLAAVGLLWMLLKPKAAAERRGGSR